MNNSRLSAFAVLVQGLTLGFVVLYLLGLFRSVYDFVTFMDYGYAFMGDFITVYEPTGRKLFTEGLPPWGYYYSGFFAVLLAVLCELPGEVPYVAWGVMQGIAIVGYWCGAVNVVWRSGSIRRQVLWTLLVFLSVPLLHNLRWGQVSTFLFLLVGASYVCHRDGRKLLAAFLLSVGIAIKFYPAIFLLHFIVRRDYRTALHSVFFAVLLLFVVPAPILGFRENAAYMAHAMESMQRWQWFIEINFNSQYFQAVVTRLAGWSRAEARAYAPILTLVGYAIAAANVLLLWKAAGRFPSESHFWSLGLLSGSLPFLFLTSWPHYFVHLPLIQLWLLVILQESDIRPPMRRFILCALVIPSMILATIPFRHFLMLVTNAPNLMETVPIYSSPGFLFSSNLLALIAVYTLYLLRGRPQTILHT